MHRYVLIKPDNTTRTYHLRNCAEMYQRIFGGYVIDILINDDE
jgi:hypothetical protein